MPEAGALVTEDAVTELLAIDLSSLHHLFAPAGRDADRNLYRPAQIAEWVNDSIKQR